MVLFKTQSGSGVVSSGNNTSYRGFTGGGGWRGPAGAATPTDLLRDSNMQRQPSYGKSNGVYSNVHNQ